MVQSGGGTGDSKRNAIILNCELTFQTTRIEFVSIIVHTHMLFSQNDVSSFWKRKQETVGTSYVHEKVCSHTYTHK